MTSNPNENKESVAATDPTTDAVKRLDTISRNWSQFVEQFLDNTLNRDLSLLCKTSEENNQLLDTIEEKHKSQLKETITKSDLVIADKTPEELTEPDLVSHSTALKTDLDALSSALTTKKQTKSQLSDKTKALSQQLERMETTSKELKNENSSNKNNEYLTLASTMRLMYKMWHNNAKVVGLLFNDNEDKSLERLIVMERDNRTEEQMSEQFWQSLSKDYGFE